RSCHHDSPGHVNSTHTMLTGYPGELEETPPYKPKYPDVWAVTNKVVGDWSSGVPPYVALGTTRYNGSAYLGAGVDPPVVGGDPNSAEFRVKELTVEAGAQARFTRRAGLLQSFDAMRRTMDAAVDVGAFDVFQQKAISVLTSDAVGKAFDLQREDPKLRDRYG